MESKRICIVTILVIVAIIATQITAERSNNILLDVKSETIDEIEYKEQKYRIVKVTNILPYSSGIEIISADGTTVTEPNTAKSILNAVAWKQAANWFHQDTIKELGDTRDTLKNIEKVVSPFASASNTVVSKIDWLRGICLKVKYYGDYCVWNILTSVRWEIAEVEDKIREINDYLTEWETLSSESAEKLSSFLNNIEEAKKGKVSDDQIQDDMQYIISTFHGKGDLYRKVVKIHIELSKMSEPLEEVEKVIKLKVGIIDEIDIYLKSLADAIGTLNSPLKTFENQTRNFRNTILSQSYILSGLKSAVESRTDELYTSWETRHDAPKAVTITLIAPVLVIAGILVVRKKRGKGPKEETEESKPYYMEIPERTVKKRKVPKRKQELKEKAIGVWKCPHCSSELTRKSVDRLKAGSDIRCPSCRKTI